MPDQIIEDLPILALSDSSSNRFLAAPVVVMPITSAVRQRAASASPFN